MPAALANHYRIPEGLVEVGLTGDLSQDAGFFRFGGSVCYGQVVSGAVSSRPAACHEDLLGQVSSDGQRVLLPFDFSDVVRSLQQERYTHAPFSYSQQVSEIGSLRSLYYQLIRPALPFAVRRQLQRLGLRGWDRIAFPRWPVDISVETLMEQVLALVLTHTGVERLPFIWFWPDGAPACAMMTHDVEERAGLEFCDQLMDMDEAHGVPAAFQLIPESRYEISKDFLERLSSRGFEINVHDLDHDGRLFRDRDLFLRRAPFINGYVERFGSRGFRAGAMYRRQEWFDALNISYDMSVPTVAHLEPQRGGCCTVTPYFIGKVLELPLTTIQDYSLFHILGDYSTQLWVTQSEQILARHGLISFIAHPDYLIAPRAQAVYRELLAYIGVLRDERHVWLALPGDVDRWWRERSEMQIVWNGREWQIQGRNSGRARLAYARLDGDRVVYDIAPAKVRR